MDAMAGAGALQVQGGAASFRGWSAATGWAREGRWTLMHGAAVHDRLCLFGHWARGGIAFRGPFGGRALLGKGTAVWGNL